MASQVKEDHEKEIEQSDDKNDCVFSEMADAVNEALDEVGNEIKNIKDSALGFLDEVTNDVTDIIEKFLVSLPIAQVIGPGSDDENLGNNVHFQNPFQTYGEPYRFGLHITRDDLGYKVARIFENTIAYHVKLQENDILTHLDDTDLSTTNLVKAKSLFYKVSNPFKLSFLREVDSGEPVEFVIEISITSDEVGQSVDILLSCPRYSPSRDSLTPNYITHDPDGESQQYVNLAPNGSLVLGNEPVPFVLEKYSTFNLNDPRLPSVLKTLDGNLAFDFNQQKMMDFNPRNIEGYLLNTTLVKDGSCLFEKYGQDDDDDRYFLHYSGHQIEVQIVDNPKSPPLSTQFVMYPINEDDATSSDDEDTPSTTHTQGGRDH